MQHPARQESCSQTCKLIMAKLTRSNSKFASDLTYTADNGRFSWQRETQRR
jgi:hypothetical protein